jgi:hypothetical protein
MAKVMKHPKAVFGSSSCLDEDVLGRMGFNVELIGRSKQNRD